MTEKKAPKKKGKAASKKEGDVGAMIQKAQSAYMNEIQAGGDAIRKRYGEAYTAYYSGIEAVQKDLGGRFLETYRTYIENLQQAFGETERYEKCLDAYRTYAENLATLYQGQNLTTNTQEAYQSFVETATAAQTSANPTLKYQEALNDYTLTLQKVWSQESLMEAIEQSHAAYVEALEALQEDVKQESENAYKQLIDGLQSVWMDSNASMQANQVMMDYHQALQEAMGETHALMKGATQAAVQVLETAAEAEIEDDQAE